MEWEDIAITGMSGVLPGADNLELFRENLKSGKDCIGKVPLNRLELCNLDRDKSYLECGYLNHIEYFDYEFFGISRGEAISMDPQKRIVLTEIYKAIANAGYSYESMRGTKTAVILSCGNSGYGTLRDTDARVSFLGNLEGMVAGNIAHFLDLRGKAMMVDVTCASSLLAIYEAAVELIRGDADMALAGGVSAYAKPQSTEGMDYSSSGVLSRNMRSRSFDEKADGTGVGEGAAVVLLKRLKDAVRDKDHIYGVIKGGAANHTGKRGNSIVAPSATAQTEVIKRAWEVAGVDASKIEMIEAHGTGTKIGDPIEIDGLNQAFADAGAEGSDCYITAVKSSIGHLGMAAGAASFVKAALALKYREIYPLVNFTNPNPLIDWKNSPVVPCRETESFKEDKPVAVVTGLGLSGTNVHLVLEAYEEPVDNGTENGKSEYICTLSGRDEELFNEYRDSLVKYLNNREDLKPASFSRTITEGRDHYSCRSSFLFSNRDELIRKLGEAELYRTTKPEKVVLLSSGDIDTVLNKREFFSLTEENHSSDTQSDIEKYLGFYESFTSVMDKMGITFNEVAGFRGGNSVVEVVINKRSISSAAEMFETYKQRSFNREGFAEYARANGENTLFITLEPESEMVEILREERVGENLIYGKSENSLLSQLYIRGFDINWQNYHWERVEKTDLPPVPFKKSFCWFDKESIISEKPSESGREGKSFKKQSIEETLTAIWRECLQDNSIGIDDDFFDLGGNSIVSLKMVQMTHEAYGEVIDLDDFYDYATIREMGAFIREKLDVEAETERVDPYHIEAVSKEQYYPVSEAQKRMWVVSNTNPNTTEYNMPGTMYAEGDVDVEKFCRSFERIVDIHEGFRSSFHLIDGEVVQKIDSESGFKVNYEEINEYQLEEYKADFIQPFDLSVSPLIRVTLLKTGERKYVSLVDMHHIISDGTSMGVVSRDFLDLYGGKDIVAPEIEYKDFASWQIDFNKSPVKLKQDEYWIEELTGVEEKLATLPLDFERPSMRTHEGGVCSFTIDPETVEELKKLCSKHKVTLNILLTSVYFMALAKWTGGKDISVGMPISGRRTSQLDRVTGMFVNMLVIYLDMDMDERYSDFLQRLKTKAVKAYENQDTQLNDIVESLNIERRANRHPLFDTMFVLQEIDMPVIEQAGVKLRYVNEDESAKFDMNLAGHHTEEGIVFKVRYWKKLFREETIENMVTGFMEIVSQIIEDRNEKLGDIGSELMGTKAEASSFRDVGFDF